MNVRPRLTLSGRGLGAGVTIGPLRITRSGRGRFSFSLRVPRANGRARGPCPGAWPAPEGAPLPPSTRPAMARPRCARPDCHHGPGYHDGKGGTDTVTRPESGLPLNPPVGRCHHRGCGCRQWLEVDDPAVVGHTGVRDLFGPPQGPRLAGPREGA